MGNSRDRVVLLTGFGAFPGARTNPTMAIVRSLARSRRFALRSLRIETAILPVVYGEIEGVAANLIARRTGRDRSRRLPKKMKRSWIGSILKPWAGNLPKHSRRASGPMWKSDWAGF